MPAKIEEIEAGTLEDGTKRIIKILTLSASAFPGESEESKRRLLVRQCYEELADIMLAHSQQKGRVFVLNGNPGIGKSLFSFYFTWRLAHMGGQTFVWERESANQDGYLIPPAGVFGRSMGDFSHVLAEEDTWYLVDGKPPKHADAKTILVYSQTMKTSMMLSNGQQSCGGGCPYGHGRRSKPAGVHIFGQQESNFGDRYVGWLGIPRYVLQLLDEADQTSLEKAIGRCGLEVLAQSFASLTAHKLISHMLVHVQVEAGYLEGPTQIAGGYIKDRLAAKYVEARDSHVEHFLAASGDTADPESGRLIHVP